MFDFSKLFNKGQAALEAARAFKDAAQIVPDLIEDAEAAIGAGNGASKLEIVKTKVSAFLELLGHTTEAVAAALPKIVQLVTTLVTVFTLLGVKGFEKKS